MTDGVFLGRGHVYIAWGFGVHVYGKGNVGQGYGYTVVGGFSVLLGTTF